MDGGHFLVQHVDLGSANNYTRGVEYIGYDTATDGLTSHFFSNAPEVLRYAWELEDDTLTIWFGEKGSPTRCVGTFADDNQTASATWEWPGGGYSVQMKRG